MITPISPAEARLLAEQLLGKGYDQFHAQEQAVYLMVDVLHSIGYADMLEVLEKLLKIGNK
jgi:hypothetical protein